MIYKLIILVKCVLTYYKRKNIVDRKMGKRKFIRIWDIKKFLSRRIFSAVSRDSHDFFHKLNSESFAEFHHINHTYLSLLSNKKLTFVIWSGTWHLGHVAKNMLRMKKGLQHRTNVKKTSPKTCNKTEMKKNKNNEIL